MPPTQHEPTIEVRPVTDLSSKPKSSVGRVVLYCIALASLVAALFAMLFETGSIRELAIFITAFGIPTIPFASMEYANRLADRVAAGRAALRASADAVANQVDAQAGDGEVPAEPGVAIAIRMAGLGLGIAGGILCLYILVTSLAIRAQEPKRRRPMPPMEMQTAAIATRPGPAPQCQQVRG